MADHDPETVRLLTRLEIELRNNGEAVERLERLVFIGNGRVPLTQLLAHLEDRVLALEKRCSGQPAARTGGAKKERAATWTAIVVAIVSAVSAIVTAWLANQPG